MTEFVDGFTNGVIAERQRVITMLGDQIKTLEFELSQDNGFFEDQLNNFIFITKDYIKLIEGKKND